VLNLILFIGAMIFFIGCGLLPAESWRSGFKAAAGDAETDKPVTKTKVRV
jgi:hypothetical protein